MKRFLAATLLCVGLSAPRLFAQLPEGAFEGYDGEWKHVSQQLVALAEATPAEKFAWRPAPNVRSTSEVYMHIAYANFLLLAYAGPKMPEGFNRDVAKSVTSKAEVVGWLKRSLEAVRQAHANATAKDLERHVRVFDERDCTVEGVYLRILVHDNEHMGQLIGYARMSGVVPPWADK